MSAHWHSFAARWHRLGSPMRPGPEDVELFQDALGDRPGDCLLLGVTPELAQLSAHLTALDNSADMIRALWPKDRHACLGDWLGMPFEDASFDHVIGDGCPVLLDHPLQQARLFAEAARVLRPEGRMVMRVFVGPEQPKTPEQVCDMAFAGEIRGFHAFKWRLSMALAARSRDYTFCIADTLRTFDRLLPDRALLMQRTGWSKQDIDTMDFYLGSSARYSYPPLSALRRIVPLELHEIEVRHGHYELAECCPILVWERRE
jgi:SAM-dependent methyltransferase